MCIAVSNINCTPFYCECESGWLGSSVLLKDMVSYCIYLPLAFLIGLKKSFQCTIHVWWLYWFSIPFLLLPFLPSPLFPLMPPFSPLQPTFHIAWSDPAVTFYYIFNPPPLCVATGYHFQTVQIKALEIFSVYNHSSQDSAMCKMWSLSLTNENSLHSWKSNVLATPLCWSPIISLSSNLPASSYTS